MWLAAGAGLYSLGEHGTGAQLLIGGALATVIYAGVGVIEDDPGGAALGGLLPAAAAGVSGGRCG